MQVVNEGCLKKLQIRRYSQAVVPMKIGTFTLTVYRNNRDDTETLVLTQGVDFDGGNEDPLFLRLHSECLTGDVFGSLCCDCGEQLQAALSEIQRRGAGVLIYLRQEGRGIGLGNKLRAYDLQHRQGLNTLEANEALGFPVDMREYDLAAMILKDLGIKNVLLNSNNPLKAASLRNFGLTIVSVEPSIVPPNEHNVDYIRAKEELMGHTLGGSGRFIEGSPTTPVGSELH